MRTQACSGNSCLCDLSHFSQGDSISPLVPHSCAPPHSLILVAQTAEAFARQRLLQELYESRFASMQRLVAFFVAFHAMGKAVSDFWPNVSGGILGYDMSKTQSIMRIATTASPVSGMEVRQRVLQLQEEQEFKYGAKKLQAALRYRRAMAADDDTLLVMMRRGQITHAQLAQIIVQRAQQRNEHERNEPPDGERGNEGPRMTDAQRLMITQALQGRASLSSLGPQRLHAAVEFFEITSWSDDEVVMTQGDTNCNHFYIVESGEFSVRVEHKSSKPIAVMGRGHLFGETALLYKVPRNATITCTCKGKLWSLDWKVLNFLTMGMTLRRADLNLNVLRKMPQLVGLTEEQLDVAASAMELVEMEGGTEIAAEGNLAEVVYVIVSGRLILSRQGHATASGEVDEGLPRRMQLCAPSYVGEHSLDYSPFDQSALTSLPPGAVPDFPSGCTSLRPPPVRTSSSLYTLASPCASPSSTVVSPDMRRAGSPGLKGAILKGVLPPTERRKPPPLWFETLTTDPDAGITQLLWLSREKFIDLIGPLPEVIRRNAIDKFLEDATELAHLLPHHKALLVDRFESCRLAANTTLCVEGEAADALYVLLRGTVSVSHEDELHDGRQRVVRHDNSILGKFGATYGQTAVLSGKLCDQTVVTTCGVEVLRLSRQALADLPKANETASLTHHDQQRCKEARRRRALGIHRMDLETLGRLSTGMFGPVDLVRMRTTSEVFALKSLSKAKLIEARHVTKTIVEKRILDLIEHPFCASLKTVFSDADPRGNVHMLLDACHGGEEQRHPLTALINYSALHPTVP